MAVSNVPVCRDTDRSKPLEHPEYLMAVGALLSCPPNFAHIQAGTFADVAYDVASGAPRPNSSFFARAQRLVRKVRRGCFTRPAFCIMMCEIFDSPEELMDNAKLEVYRLRVVQVAGNVWDAAYRVRAVCKEHEGDWDKDEVRAQTHGFFE